MANRKIPTEEKVNIMAQCLALEGVEEAAVARGVSPGAIYYWFNKKVLPVLPIILANEKPGPNQQTAWRKRSDRQLHQLAHALYPRMIALNSAQSAVALECGRTACTGFSTG